VQVGDVVTNNVLKPIGHTLEIVPLEHPYKLAGNTLSVQVIFKGKPLSNALIDAYSLVDHSAKEQAVNTDSEGKATFKFDVEGPVILNTVWGVPLTNSSAADFETYFSSLTFEYFQSPTK
jgi:ABC-type Co2+ transport system, periplasmic component